VLEEMSKNSLILSFLFVIVAMEVCYGMCFLLFPSPLNVIIYICIKNIKSCLYVGHSLSKESDIVVIACQNVGDCHIHSSALPCDPEYISCYEGYCVWDNDTISRFFDPQSYPPTWQLIF